MNICHYVATHAFFHVPFYVEQVAAEKVQRSFKRYLRLSVT